MIEQRGDDRQHEQREADAEETDEGEELAPEQDLHRKHEVMIQHGRQFTWRPSNSRTMRSV